MIADMISNKEINPIVNQSFIRGRKLNIPIAFITQAYINVPEEVGLNTPHFLSCKFQTKKNFKKLH